MVNLINVGHSIFKMGIYMIVGLFEDTMLGIKDSNHVAALIV